MATETRPSAPSSNSVAGAGDVPRPVRPLTDARADGGHKGAGAQEDRTMQLDLVRHTAIDDATIGTLSIDGSFQCCTLEDVIRDKKIAKVTAIPAGTYNVILCESPKFSDSYEEKGLGRIVPLIDGVPGFSGIRIHVGNKASHSDGCVLVGDWSDHAKAEITNSTAAFKALMKKLNAAGKGSIRIAIRNEVDKPEAKLPQPSLPLFTGMYPFIRQCFPPPG